MMRVSDLVRLRWLLGTLLIVAAALFAIGVATEGDSHTEAGKHLEATEQAEHNEQREASETGERVLGIDLESTPFVVLAVGISVVLAAATWKDDRKLILLVATLFAAAFAVLDVVELAHQVKQSATAIAVIAGIVAVMHAVAAFLAGQRRAAMP